MRSVTIIVACRIYFDLSTGMLCEIALVVKPSSDQFLVAQGRVELGSSFAFSFPPGGDSAHSSVVEALAFRPNTGVDYSDYDVFAVTGRRPSARVGA